MIITTIARRHWVCLVFTVVLCLAVTAPASAAQIYIQPFDGTGNAYSSQNDTSGGNGLYAQTYDDFTLGSNATVTNVEWTGEFYNPSIAATITAFTVSFYADAAGQPGGLLNSFPTAGDANETFLGNYGGFSTYTYSLNIGGFAALAGTTYWLSVVPDVGEPPQWGWSVGTSGNGVAFQTFFGSRSQLNADLAFTLNVDDVPEPGSVILVGCGLLLGGAMRRKQRA